jgi:subtilisin family serine protease
MQASAEMIKAGIFLAVAAGNEANSVHKVSPAAEESVCTVGAFDSRDNYAGFSNFGEGVDISAPGVSIMSAWNRVNLTHRTLTGTSMASPHITGLGAYLLSLEGGKYEAGKLCQQIKDMAIVGKIKGIPHADQYGKQANLMAFNGVQVD